MSRRTELADRVEMIGLAQGGQSDTQIAEAVGYSRWTVRKWRRRHRDQGRTGLRTKMGRPKQGALSTYPAEMREAIEAWRRAHPGWGAKTLRTELEQDESFKRMQLPSLRSINRFLKEKDLVEPYERHSVLPQSEQQMPRAAHEEWDVDARGHEYIPEVGVIELINLTDCFTRTRLLSYPCLLGHRRLSRRAATEDYLLIFRQAFTEWGLPERIASDHHRIFYDGKSKSPFPTRLHFWLIALGVSLTFGRFHCPTDQSIAERSHQLWEKQVLQGQVFRDWDDLFQALQKRRLFLNTQLPCASLGEKPPLVAHPEALTNSRLYRPEWEVELLDVSRIHAYLAQGHWFRLVSSVGTFSLGGQVYYLKQTWAGQQVEITFDPDDLQFVVYSDDGQQIRRFFPKGITTDDLMGEMSPLTNLPAFQLALPFSWQDWRRARLSGALMGMT
jgi:transposase